MNKRTNNNQNKLKTYKTKQSKKQSKNKMNKKQTTWKCQPTKDKTKRVNVATDHDLTKVCSIYYIIVVIYLLYYKLKCHIIVI